MKDIALRSAEQLGAALRLKRKEKGFSQNRLAELVGVERKWVIRLEAGNPSAELGLILKVLKALGIGAYLSDEDHLSQGKAPRTPSSSRLDEVFQQLERRARR